MEFMVSMTITFPDEMPLSERRKLLEAESAAAAPYLDSGQFARVWRTWGSHESSHGHLALWNAPDSQFIWETYATFPLVAAGYGLVWEVTELMTNPNDRKSAPLVAEAPFALTYYNLERFLTLHGEGSLSPGEGITATIAPGVTIHDHPHSGRPRELHFMVDGQKIAEIGPTSKSGSEEDVAPGYIDLLAEWDGRPVHHDTWKNRILADNGLLFPDHHSAKNAPRVRREIS